jgi:hypothetical protein
MMFRENDSQQLTKADRPVPSRRSFLKRAAGVSAVAVPALTLLN